MRNKVCSLIISIILLHALTACHMATTMQSDEAEEKIDKAKSAKINAQLGMAYLEQQDFHRAKQKLLLALDEAPNAPESLYSMAYFQETTGNLPEAKQYYLRAIKVAAKRGDVQNNYGTFLCRQGEYQAAIDHFMLAVKDGSYLNPGDAYENAGLCALKMKAPREAKVYFQRALQEDPERKRAKIKLAQLNEGFHGNA